MVITKQPDESCKTCKTVLKRGAEVHACDECGVRLVDDGGNLEITVFHHAGGTKRLELCSWSCTIRAARKVRTDYFATLPYLSFDEKRKGHRARDFFAAIKQK